MESIILTLSATIKGDPVEAQLSVPQDFALSFCEGLGRMLMEAGERAQSAEQFWAQRGVTVQNSEHGLRECVDVTACNRHGDGLLDKVLPAYNEQPAVLPHNALPAIKVAEEMAAACQSQAKFFTAESWENLQEHVRWLHSIIRRNVPADEESVELAESASRAFGIRV